MTKDDPRAPGAGRVEGTNELHWKGGGLVGNHNPTLSTPTMSTLPGSLCVPNPIAIEHLADIIDTRPDRVLYKTGHDHAERYTVPEEPVPPLAAVLREMTAVSDVRTTLPPEFVAAVRFAALVALDAGRDSYLSLLRAAAERGLVLDDAQQVLVVLAPLLGTERTSSASAKVAEAVRLLRAVRDANDELNADDGQLGKPGLNVRGDDLSG
jgi:hypothetical protein